MKLLFILIPLFLFMSCDSGTTPTNNHDLSVSFTLADTLGNQTTIFHTGSSFDMAFSVKNLTGKPLTYGFTGTPVVFQILSADSVFAGSTDFLTFTQDYKRGTLDNQATYTDRWRAPNTIGRQKPLVLLPGQYKARILHNFFNEFRMEDPQLIPFTIIQ